MPLITKLARLYLKPRLREIDRFRQRPAEVQAGQLDYLLAQGRDTVFGRERGMPGITNAEQFRQNVPVIDYEHFHEYIMRTKGGEQNVFWPTPIRWFAKSSGTTDAKSKYVPVSQQGLKQHHLQGPRDVVALYLDAHQESQMLDGKTLTLGGSKKVEREGEMAFSGDLSAIMIENTPWYANLKRVPRPQTALIPDFEEKVRRICEETVKQDVRAFAGVPSWNLVMMNKVLEYTGAKNLLEVWPNLELFMYGGMNFKPYRDQYEALIPTGRMNYMETYNASEGFFGIADDPAQDDMLLMLDYGIYYEFLPTDSLGDTSKAVPLEGARTGVNYAMIITTCNGLWRYMIGDTVEFTSTSPYRIRVTGRTKHYINAFGEEIVIENAERAMEAASHATGAVIAEYSAAPVYMEGKTKGRHEWVVEFKKAPASIEDFTRELDMALQRVNSDYEAKRFRDTTLLPPRVSVVEPGTFMAWLSSKGKLGGQNKVPRLFNDRTFVDELLAINKK